MKTSQIPLEGISLRCTLNTIHSIFLYFFFLALLVGNTESIICPASMVNNNQITRTVHSYSGYNAVHFYSAKIGPSSGDFYYYYYAIGSTLNTIVRRETQAGVEVWTKDYSTGYSSLRKTFEISKAETYAYFIHNSASECRLYRINTSAGSLSQHTLMYATYLLLNIIMYKFRNECKNYVLSEINNCY